jgi:hypothetical protein
MTSAGDRQLSKAAPNKADVEQQVVPALVCLSQQDVDRPFAQQVGLTAWLIHIPFPA